MVHCCVIHTVYIYIIIYRVDDHINIVDGLKKKPNAMIESLELFGSVCNNRLTRSSTIILLLNKHDGFVDSLKKESLRVCFSKNYGWQNEQWDGPDYDYNNKYNDLKEDTAVKIIYENTRQYSNVNHISSTNCNEVKDIDEEDVLQYFPGDSSIVNDTLSKMKDDQLFVDCYKYSLSFIVKQYIQMSKHYQPCYIDQTMIDYRCNRKIHAHVIDALNEKDVLSMFDSKLGIVWQHERLIWIAYYKNDENDQCLLKTVPKDVLVVIVLFLRNQFSIWKCMRHDQLQKCDI